MPTLLNPGEFPSICARVRATAVSKLHVGARPEHAPSFPILRCAKEPEHAGWMGATDCSSGSHACSLRLAGACPTRQLWHIGKVTESGFVTLYPREQCSNVSLTLGCRDKGERRNKGCSHEWLFIC